MQKLEKTGYLKVFDKSIEYLYLSEYAEHDYTIVMLHEGLGSVALWKDFPEQLALQTKCRVFVYSRFGYGKSDKVELPRPISYMHNEGLEVLPQVLDLIEHDKYILLGHSDGASVSIIYTGAKKDERLKALIVMAPHVSVEKVCIDSIEKSKTLYQDAIREPLSKYHDDVDNAFWGWNQAWLHPDFIDWNIEEYLSPIEIPVLVIQGADDEYGTINQVDKVCSQVFGKAEKIILPDCKHSPHRDQTELTLEGVSRFIKKEVFEKVELT